MISKNIYKLTSEKSIKIRIYIKTLFTHRSSTRLRLRVWVCKTLSIIGRIVSSSWVTTLWLMKIWECGWLKLTPVLRWTLKTSRCFNIFANQCFMTLPKLSLIWRKIRTVTKEASKLYIEPRMKSNAHETTWQSSSSAKAKRSSKPNQRNFWPNQPTPELHQTTQKPASVHSLKHKPLNLLPKIKGNIACKWIWPKI